MPGLGRQLIDPQDMAVFAQWVRLRRRNRPHIIHTHTAKAGALGRLAAWVAGVPVVVRTYHGHVLCGYFSRGKTRVFRARAGQKLHLRSGDGETAATFGPGVTDKVTEVLPP